MKRLREAEEIRRGSHDVYERRVGVRGQTLRPASHQPQLSSRARRDAKDARVPSRHPALLASLDAPGLCHVLSLSNAPYDWGIKAVYYL
jgi:hypothetical protein